MQAKEVFDYKQMERGRNKKLVVIRKRKSLCNRIKKLNEVTGDTREQEKQIISH